MSPIKTEIIFFENYTDGSMQRKSPFVAQLFALCAIREPLRSLTFLIAGLVPHFKRETEGAQHTARITTFADKQR